MENQYKGKIPKKKSRMILFYDDSILVKKGEQADYLTYEELERLCTRHRWEVPRMVYLFMVGEVDYFLTSLPDVLLENRQSEDQTGMQEECAYEFVRMFQMRHKHPKEQVFIAATAWHLFCWYRDNQYCGRCGKRLVHSDKMRMLACTHCGNEIFPKIAPAVIVGVTNGEFILMTQYANREYKRYALIAGFTEIGETAEETVCREVQEEVGIRVKNIRYYKSQPWGFDSNLLLGYFCELDGNAELCIEEEELAMAKWVHYNDIPVDVEGLSLTQEMMTVFRDERRRLRQTIG